MPEPNEQIRTGTISAVTGPVIDVRFPTGALPRLREALTVDVDGETRVMEVAQHVGGDIARCVMLGPSDGLSRDMPVISSGRSITVPVGDAVLGRLFNVMGDPIDGLDPVAPDVPRESIYRPAPSYAERSSAEEVLETGIKVIDLLAPYAKGGKIGLFGGAGVGKTVLIQELIRRLQRLHRCRRAQPRGQRPLDRDGRKRRHCENRAGLRPDERAARGSYARCADWPHHGGALP